MKHYLMLTLALTMVSTPLYLRASDDCDPDTQDCSNEDPGVVESVKHIYPYRPFETSKINDRVRYLSENQNALLNLREMHYQGLEKAKTRTQPWGGSYWPLNQGQIANNYQDKDYKTFIFTLFENISWATNYTHYKNRQKKIHPAILNLNEKQLAKLAPSEKYDILLGDESFDLTNKIWAYAKKWGEEKQWGFLSRIDLPDGYEIPKVSKMMALWEGICHGWAIAAGATPRPEKTVVVTLPNGKRMPFYPDDIKALISMMWANSQIQDKVMFEGNRCNKKNPAKDKYGRYIDVKMDRNDTELLPRCADTHPGIFHATMINILGVEGRSFVIDHQTGSAIGNQPVASYSYEYFNPMTGKDESFNNSIVSVEQYGSKDPYKESRNKDTTHIIGINMKLTYINWLFPSNAKTNSPKDDKTTDMEFMYDLELNASGEIVGGQWRLTKRGMGELIPKTPNWPDYFWIAPRNWSSYFQNISDLPEWDLQSGMTPPVEYQVAAKSKHAFIYEQNALLNGGKAYKCPVFPLGGGSRKMVDCEFRTPRPQPLNNIINKLLDASRN